jgi:septal ring factor EnvC (AmiA/AmiB activator)
VRKQDARPIRALKGKLPRPTKGRIIKAFGNYNAVARNKWQGWLMKGYEGSAITAVHHGRIVFSDWLRGFGLLLIIDHGDGYLSLYARNQSLLKSVGDWVYQGENIATLGSSGGFKEPRLYFEIRHKGKPQDPAAWLSR